MVMMRIIVVRVVMFVQSIRLHLPNQIPVAVVFVSIVVKMVIPNVVQVQRLPVLFV